MATSFNARAESTAPFTADEAERLLDALADYHPAVGRGLFGHTEVVITLPADSHRQAMLTGYTLLSAAFAPGAVRLFEVLTTEDFDRRLADLEHIPELVSVTEAAAALGVTRQAVLQRIESGSLPATRIGTAWAVPRSAVNA